MDKIVVITGAAPGITLALLARNREALEGAAAEARAGAAWLS